VFKFVLLYELIAVDFLFLIKGKIMNKNFKANERELVKVATFFKKQSKKLIEEGKLGEEHKTVEEAVNKFIEHMELHANARAFVLEQRDQLKHLVKDNPECPTCHKKDMLKMVGTEKNDKGWKSNRYKCRRCNIEFTWNLPNNPWDMMEYIGEVLAMMQLKEGDISMGEAERAQISLTKQSMEANLAKLKPVIDTHNKEYEEMLAREHEMERLIHEFKNTLLIEKIKMDTWENKKGSTLL
jgi:hypothetical protein